MRGLFGWIVVILYCCPPMLGASYQKAEVVSMKTVSCNRVHALDPPGSAAPNPIFVGQMPQYGAFPQQNNDACTAYELRTAKVVYHVMTSKNLILPVGETVYIRLTSREMTVHAEEGEKDIRALILDMSLIENSAAKQQEPPAPVPKPVEPVHRESTPQASARNCLSIAGDVVPCRAD